MFYCTRLDFAFTRLFPIIGFQIITETSSLEDLPCLERDKHSIRLNHCDRFPPLGNNYRRRIRAVCKTLLSPSTITIFLKKA